MQGTWGRAWPPLHRVLAFARPWSVSSCSQIRGDITDVISVLTPDWSDRGACQPLQGLAKVNSGQVEYCYVMMHTRMHDDAGLDLRDCECIQACIMVRIHIILHAPITYTHT